VANLTLALAVPLVSAGLKEQGVQLRTKLAKPAILHDAQLRADLIPLCRESAAIEVARGQWQGRQGQVQVTAVVLQQDARHCVLYGGQGIASTCRGEGVKVTAPCVNQIRRGDLERSQHIGGHCLGEHL